ncbi:hypothetical protein T07_13555 [Trichinella nelsoni]|uniref:Uncharacterized protein n=1 Tax=Trichinella nelsoni TaxID=6336 RepID=A0A0V0SDZ6_9BILA|nr:hypothetical protein T07_13555 [Trichinella nelsoni]
MRMSKSKCGVNHHSKEREQEHEVKVPLLCYASYTPTVIFFDGTYGLSLLRKASSRVITQIKMDKTLTSERVTVMHYARQRTSQPRIVLIGVLVFAKSLRSSVVSRQMKDLHLEPSRRDPAIQMVTLQLICIQRQISSVLEPSLICSVCCLYQHSV